MAFDTLISYYLINSGWINIIIILVVTYFAVVLGRKLVSLSFDRHEKDVSDKTQYRFMRHAVSALIYVVGFGVAVYTIPALRALSVSLLAGAGILAVVIGFASQAAFSNVVSGLFIAMFKPIRIGDRVVIMNINGIVEDITLRHTVIRTYENKRVIIPNDTINKESIENADIEDTKVVKHLLFDISYESDVNVAMDIIKKEALKHPNFLDNRSDKDKEENAEPITVRLVELGDSGVKLKAWIWSKDQGAAFVMGCDLKKSIKEEFKNAGIEIPYPHRSIVMKK